MEAIYHGINTYGKCSIQLGSAWVDISIDQIEGLMLHINDDDGKEYNLAISINGSYQEDQLPSGNLAHWVCRLSKDWAKFCETL